MKYELTEAMTTDDGMTLHRIRARKAFGDVKPGDLGGWVETEANLSHDGESWVYGEARVFGHARVFGSAKIYDKADVFGKVLVWGGARIYDNAKVFGSAKIYGNAKVFGDAEVFNIAAVYGNAEVFDSAWVYDNARVYSNAEVHGNAKVFGNAEVFSNAKVLGDTRLTRFLSANRSDGYTFTLLPMADGSMWISAGCRFFSFEKARDHWTRTRGGTSLGDETMLILDYLERASVMLKPGHEG